MDIELSAEELALYDRQLRVWGAEGQNHIKNASVLVINVNGIGTEIVKNLTLSGIGSIELWDHGVVDESDLSAQFFLNEDDLGELKLPCIEPRVKDMNPRVALTINTNHVRFSKENDLAYFKRFGLVVANNLTAQQLVELNEITRELKISLYITSSHGLFGFMFNDLLVDITTYKKKRMPIGRKLGPISRNQEIIKITASFDREKNEALEHITIKSSFKKFTEAIQSQNLSSLTRKQKKNVTPLLSIFIALHELQLAGSELTAESLKSTSASIQSRLGLNEITDDSYFTSVIESLDAEISPVAAILGGALAQDVINFLSKKEAPINNLLILDGNKFTMPIYEL